MGKMRIEASGKGEIALNVKIDGYTAQEMAQIMALAVLQTAARLETCGGTEAEEFLAVLLVLLLGEDETELTELEAVTTCIAEEVEE